VLQRIRVMVVVEKEGYGYEGEGGRLVGDGEAVLEELEVVVAATPPRRWLHQLLLRRMLDNPSLFLSQAGRLHRLPGTCPTLLLLWPRPQQIFLPSQQISVFSFYFSFPLFSLQYV
jgi:hypothetical protein